MHTICSRCGKPTPLPGQPVPAHDLPSRRRGNAWKPVVAAILKRDHYTCRLKLRGCTTRATLADHITPRAQGGTDNPANLIAACAACNRAKGTRTLCPACQTGGKGGGLRRTD